MLAKTELIWIAFLLLIPSATHAQAQAPLRQTSSVASPCPILVVTGPETVMAGMPITFTAQLSGVDTKSHLIFNWAVSDGIVIDGQGTLAITVDTTGVPFGKTIEASVTAEGLDAACIKTATHKALVIPGCILFSKFDEYGAISWRDEKARLDNFANELKANPSTQGYIINYGGRRGRAHEAQARSERALIYLYKIRHIDAGRIVLIDGGYREDVTTELDIIPSGAAPPTPSPTVDPSEVTIISNRVTRRRPKKS
ncbi:MAG: hypothetical protein ACJ74W_05135 [Pyrinomonadaceae bacterium]